MQVTTPTRHRSKSCGFTDGVTDFVHPMKFRRAHITKSLTKPTSGTRGTWSGGQSNTHLSVASLLSLLQSFREIYNLAFYPRPMPLVKLKNQWWRKVGTVQNVFQTLFTVLMNSKLFFETLENAQRILKH